MKKPYYLLLIIFFSQAGLCFAQNLLTLDDSLEKGTTYLLERIPARSKIVILNFQSSNTALSEYIIDSLTAHFINKGSVTVVDRRNLNILQQELHFQASGVVSDETALSIGKTLGAQSIIFGLFEPMGDVYRLHIRAIEVGTAKIQSMQIMLVTLDPVLSALLGQKSTQRLAPEGDSWKTKRFYFALRPGAGMHLYDTDGTRYNSLQAETGISLDFSMLLAVQFAQFFSVQTELMLSADSMNVSATETATDMFGYPLYSYDTAYTINTTSLIVPLLVKFTWRPKIFLLAGFGGVYFSFPAGKTHFLDSFNNTDTIGTLTSSPGFIAGGNAGIKCGPGVLFLDARYMMDFGITQFSGNNVTNNVYQRRMMTFGIGYEIGFGKF
jgi:hypothetical protein